MLGSSSAKVPGVQQRARTGAVACGSPGCHMYGGSPVRGGGDPGGTYRGPGSFMAPAGLEPYLGMPGAFLVRGTSRQPLGSLAAYGLTPTEASGYIVGWLQEAEKEAAAGPRREAVAALLRFYSEGKLLTESSEYQLRTVYPAVLMAAPQTAAKMRRQVQAIGTAGERKAVQAAVVQAREAGLGGESSGVPQWVIIAGAGAGTLVLVGLLAWGLSRGGP